MSSHKNMKSKSMNDLYHSPSRMSPTNISLTANPDAEGIEEITRRVPVGSRSSSRRASMSRVMTGTSLAPPAVDVLATTSTMTSPTKDTYTTEPTTQTTMNTSTAKVEGKVASTWQQEWVPVLPDQYTLERTTSVLVPFLLKKNSSTDTGTTTTSSEMSLLARDISARLSQTLQNRSVDATFHTAKAQAHCRTFSGVSFRMSLFSVLKKNATTTSHSKSGGNDGNEEEEEEGIMVEVQRLSGIAPDYYGHCHALLQAALGKHTESKQDEITLFQPLPVPVVIDVPSSLQEEEEEENRAANHIVEGAKTLQWIHSLWHRHPPTSAARASSFTDPPHDDGIKTKEDDYDFSQALLALQMLQSLTSVQAMGNRATALAVSTELLRSLCLYDDDSSSHWNRSSSSVGTHVLDLVLQTFDDENEDQVNQQPIVEHDDLFQQLQHLAWTILANAIQVTEGQPLRWLDHIDHHHHHHHNTKTTTTTIDRLRSVLLQALVRADRDPHRAQCAALCAEYITMVGSMNYNMTTHQSSSHDFWCAALETARDIGAARHASLQHQAQRCLQKVL